MQDQFTFFTDSFSFGIETKGRDKIPYITGYVSTPDIDLYNDVVTSECLDDMLTQVKSGNVKLDIDHEAWRERSTKIPIGKIVDAHRDVKGLWIKAILNRHSPAFKAAWNSIKEGFLDAFSIAYRPMKTVDEVVNGVKARLLEKVELLNVAITGNPVNPECKMQSVFVKSIESIRDSEEVETMNEKDEKISPDPKAEAPPEAKAEEEPKKEEEKAEEKPEEKPPEEKPEEKPAEEKKEESEEAKSLASLKEKVEAQDKRIAELKAMLEKPVLKAQVEEKSVELPEAEIKPVRTPLQLIR
jgi:HK97 family phage prohead protease